MESRAARRSRSFKLGSFPARLSFFRKGYDFFIEVSGKATVVNGNFTGDKEGQRTLLVKMNILTTISVYPNPASNMLILQTVQTGKFIVRIEDAMQHVVKTLQLSSGGSLLITSIDISSLAKGVYILRAGDDMIKFVKQ